MFYVLRLLSFIEMFSPCNAVVDVSVFRNKCVGGVRE